MVRDMTKGNSLKLIVAFCVPMIFGNLFQQLYSMVDTIIVGKFINVDALAAVGSTGSLCFLVLGFATGLCSGFAINVAQSFGKGDYSLMRKYVANSLYLCVAFSVVITIVTVAFSRQMLELMDTPADIIDGACKYITIIFAGIPATMLYNILSAVLRSVGDSKTPLIFLVIASFINIILDLLFIVVFKTGVEGAGYATVISQAISAILCVFFINKRYEILHISKDELPFNSQMCLKHLSLGVPMALQFSITAVGSILLQKAVNSFGAGVVAAVTAASRIQTMVIQPLETLGITMATFGGQNLGAKKYDRIKRGLNQSIVIGLVYSVVGCLVVVFLGGYISLLFIDKEETEIIAYTTRYLWLNGIFYPILAVLFILRNYLQGLGFSLLPMMAGVCELIARAVISLGFVSMFGYDAACLASPIAWIFADILLITVYCVKKKKIHQMCQ